MLCCALSWGKYLLTYIWVFILLLLFNDSGGALKIHEGSISSTPLSESDAKFCALESGISCANPDKPTCGSPTVIRAAEVSLSESEKNVVKGSTGQSIPVSKGINGDANNLQSVSPDLKGSDASKSDKSFTFEVSSMEDLSQREVGRSWQPFSTIHVTTVQPVNFLTIVICDNFAFASVSLIFPDVSRRFFL